MSINPTEQRVNSHLAAIKQEQAAKSLQALAAQASGRGDYVSAYELMGKAAAAWAEANKLRKLAQGFQGARA